MDPTLDQSVRAADPDRWYSSRFISDQARRANVIALYAYDAELARAERITSSGLIAEIRLTWWREVLDSIYAGLPVRRHPVAQALAAAVRSGSPRRDLLESMIDGRIAVLDLARLETKAAEAWAETTAGACTRLAMHLLDPVASSEPARLAGKAWGLHLILRRQICDPAAVTEVFKDCLASAKSAVRGVSASGFPALAHVALCDRDRTLSPLEKRLRLVLAVARGRL